MYLWNIYSVGMLARGSWRLLNKLEDSELKGLASRLPNTILHSRADSTVKKYLCAFKRWKAWAVYHHLIPIPANPYEFVLYLQYLGEEFRSKSAAEEACNAISWVHATSGLANHPLVKTTLSGLQRILAKPVMKKEPMAVEMIEAIVLDAEKTGLLSDMQLATACVLGYAGFLRFSELVELTPANFTISNEMMTIRIAHSKTDQLRQGDEVAIARTKSRICPVSMLERYLLRVGMTTGDSRPLFRAIQKTKHGEKLIRSWVSSSKIWSA